LRRWRILSGALRLAQILEQDLDGFAERYEPAVEVDPKPHLALPGGMFWALGVHSLFGAIQKITTMVNIYSLRFQ
jgi:hypothetical protein